VAVVLHFRDAGLTATCLQSLAADGIRHVVVVDNSADLGNSWRNVRNLLDDGDAWSLLQVALIYPGTNLGFASGVNLGMRAACREFGPCRVLLLNSDAQAVPGMTAALMLALDGAPQLAVAAPILVDDHGFGASPMRHYQAFSGLHFRSWVPLTFPYLSGCAMMLSEGASEGRINFDESFFFYGEDVAFSLDLERQGGALIVAVAATCRHSGSGTSRRYSRFYEYNLCKGQRLLARRLLHHKLWRYTSWPLRESLMLARTMIHAIRSRSTEPMLGYLGMAPKV
jgi:GT2 family glycosyltransferase